MRINGGVQLNENGLKTAIRAMQVQTALMANVSDNVNGFDKVGYQRKEAVVSSFTEFLGIDGLSTVVDDTVGRLSMTDNPLDLAMASKGYFQIQTPDGIRMTRDGRFKVDVDGNFLDLEGNQVLSNTGVPIKFDIIPKSPKDVVVNTRGAISILDRKTKNILKRLEDYVDQVLYYVRSENAEKDYFIKEVDLSKVIKNVGIKNMDDLLDNKVEFIVDKTNYKVFTDSKWLEFILNQIINNSIKYKRNIDNSYIKIYVKDNLDTTVLIIEDNGIGIKTSDIRQVFDKTFTGTNGREKTTSTGMGLYIAKNLCKKLGHKIEIESKENEYTRVFITFAKNKFYDVLK